MGVFESASSEPLWTDLEQGIISVFTLVQPGVLSRLCMAKKAKTAKTAKTAIRKFHFEDNTDGELPRRNFWILGWKC
jgi:hypothetical protein